MSDCIRRICLSWRKERGEKRVIVGIIRRNYTNGVRFNYSITAEKAKEIGFSPYIDFPDIEKTYNDNVLDIFGQRLTRPERPDIQSYYDFWEVKPEFQNDKYYLLAHTQGLLATDNFEFLAEYDPCKNLSFISEICGLSHTTPPVDCINVGDELKWKRDRKNKHDQYAVKLFVGNVELGYVKQVHAQIFSKTKNNLLKVRVKSIEKNGHLNRVFIKIYYSG